MTEFQKGREFHLISSTTKTPTDHWQQDTNMAPIDAVFDEIRASLTASAATKVNFNEKTEAILSALRPIHFHTSKIHTVPPSKHRDLMDQVDLTPLVESVGELKDACEPTVAYHKYSGMWAEPLESSIAVVLLKHWLSTVNVKEGRDSSAQSNMELLMHPQKVGEVFNVPISNYDDPAAHDKDAELKEATVLHISIRNYLQAVLVLCNELSRLALNSVTTAAASDDSTHPTESFLLPVIIGKFLKDVQAAYLSLNLKNDSLRRKTDALKYDVKNVEQVVYDLSLRRLI